MAGVTDGELGWKFVWSGKQGRVRTRVNFTEVTVWLDEVKDEAVARRRLEKRVDVDEIRARALRELSA